MAYTTNANKSKKLDEMDNFLETCNLSKLSEGGQSYINLKEIEYVAKNLFTKNCTKPKLFYSQVLFNFQRTDHLIFF